MDSERRIEYVNVDDLRAAPRNAKAHDAGAIIDSLDRFGYVEPIVLDERTGRIISGHGRWEQIVARRTSGGDAPEGVRVEGDAWHVAVVRGWASEDDDEADAAAIALNRAGERGGWDLADLGDLLHLLTDTGDGLTGIGFTFGELDDLMAGLGDTTILPPQETDADYRPGAEEWAEGVRNNGGGQTKAGQGMNEVVLMLQGDAFREFQAAAAVLRRAWRQDPLPLLVLRAMREAAEA